MIYLTLFYILFTLFFAIYGIAAVSKNKALTDYMKQNGGLFFVMISSLALIGIITKDPVEIMGLSIPTELQWLGSLLASGFGLWKFYLNPLKEKVYSFDREIGETKAEVHHVRDNTNRIEQDLESIKETMLKIANSMTPKKK